MGKKGSFFKAFFKTLVLLIPTIGWFLFQLNRTIGRELRQVGSSVTAIFILSLIALLLLGMVWLCIEALLLLWLMTWPLSIAVSLFILLMLNLVLLMIAIVFILRYKANLSFIETRQFLRNSLLRS